MEESDQVLTEQQIKEVRLQIEAKETQIKKINQKKVTKAARIEQKTKAIEKLETSRANWKVDLQIQRRIQNIAYEEGNEMLIKGIKQKLEAIRYEIDGQKQLKKDIEIGDEIKRALAKAGEELAILQANELNYSEKTVEIAKQAKEMLKYIRVLKTPELNSLYKKMTGNQAGGIVQETNYIKIQNILTPFIIEYKFNIDKNNSVEIFLNGYTDCQKFSSLKNFVINYTKNMEDLIRITKKFREQQEQQTIDHSGVQGLEEEKERY